MRPAHKAYRAAAASIRRGWAQNVWRDDDGNVCLLQAVLDALGLRGDARMLPMQFQLQIDSQLAQLPSYCPTKQLRDQRSNLLEMGESLQQLIYEWNDSPGRTVEEVIGVLDALADRAEAEYSWYIHDIIRRAIRIPNYRVRRTIEAELTEAI